MTNPTPSATPLTDDQVAAIEARLETATPGPWRTVTNRPRGPWADRDCIPLAPDGRPVLMRNWKEACLNAALIAHAPDDIASLLADRTALTRQLTDYALLREAVNASTTACAPDCTDEHAAHCPSHDPARWLIDQRREITALTRRVEELTAAFTQEDVKLLRFIADDEWNGTEMETGAQLVDIADRIARILSARPSFEI